MKNINIKSFLVYSFILCTSVACVNEKFDTPSTNNLCESLTANKKVTDFTTQAPTSGFTTHKADDIIEAVVTSSDEGGTFYKSISFESIDNGSGTVGFSIPVDQSNLHTEFEPGRKVYIKMNGLSYTNKNASTIIGEIFNNETPNNTADDQVGRISFVTYKNIIKKSCENVGEERIVKKPLFINQILNDSYINKLIELKDVQFLDASVGKKYFDPTLNNLGSATNHLITDLNGNKIIVRISEFAKFASKIISNKNGKIRGILTKFGSDYQFIPRTERDIQLTEDRKEVDLAPALGGSALTYSGSFTENFDTYTAGSVTTGTKDFPKYINDPLLGSKYWYVTSFSSNKYIVMSAFNSASSGQEQNNKSYFIVPVDFTAANSMSFKTQDRFNTGSVLKVYYSTNYVPFSKVSDASLTDITSNFTIASGTLTGTTKPFVNSGVFNFPVNLTGNGYIIFEYSGGYSLSPARTTTIHIDDIVVN
ncbi:MULTISPECIES: DUF5689 domain-containing protein [Flavobacterium]|uniref:DUF5689 domain-containing protein n=1 Tax=Flavobacterium columnare TaxID=996 RepID=A0AA94F5K1_9FLAO|nr:MULTISPECIES: DUF5689 domain-containing protein [Flavobacterium]MCH4830057.1 hypothetical protein [Flavobacterium columnare]MCH4832563.1 hypothetical protein [Flavobacterium columnare]OWP87710.1 hypothetical protein BWK60_02375 [Flavobacterium covae]